MILDGIRVLDFTQYLAGPTVTRLMSEMGAEIVKIERAPAGDPSRALPAIRDGRSGYFVQQNLGKQSVCLDMSRPETDDIVRDLVAKVDVVVENFGPGVMDKRGWNFEALTAINPRLVMASLSAFGRNSPLAHKTGFDWIAQAFAGVMYVTGPREGTPHPVGMGMADVNAGVHTFAAIGYALFNRERRGEGQWLDISMIDSLFHMHEINLQVPQVTDGAFQPGPVGNHHQLLCPCGVYKGPEGYIALLVVQNQWAGLCRAMERPDLETDPRFAEQSERAANQDALIPIIEQWMAGFDEDADVLRRLDEHRVPSGPVLNPADAVHHPYFLERGTVRPVDDPILGRLMLPGFPLRFSSQTDYAAQTAPLLGEHNEAVLGGLLGYDAARLRALADAGVTHSGAT
ncbi:MAG: CaiB/BaiF CoA transferase family protein [Gammaproteobacteria bacterium]